VSRRRGPWFSAAHERQRRKGHWRSGVVRPGRLLRIVISSSLMALNNDSKKKSGVKALAQRPKRGSPELTRERIIDGASHLFNQFGYHGTDSNSIAKEAGYATGTFYKHFQDKRAVFLAVYERWLTAEWKAIDEELSRERPAHETARRIVDISIKFHAEWRGLRASLMELIFSDEDARKFFRKQRRRQLKVMSQLRQRLGLTQRTREQDAIHLFLTERVFDALGQGEIQALGLDRKVVVDFMVETVLSLLQ
jgi:AcrR family transcriptional regulator